MSRQAVVTATQMLAALADPPAPPAGGKSVPPISTV
jgi:hypothetical protein